MSNYISIRIREGAERLYREHPDLDGTLSTPAITAAERRLDDALRDWKSGRCDLDRVRAAWKGYASAIVEANRVQEKLFA